MNEREDDKGGMLGKAEACKWAEGFEIIDKHTHTNSKCVVNACNSGSPVKIFSIIVCCINGDRMKHQNSYNGFLAQHLLLKFLLFFALLYIAKHYYQKLFK